MRAFVDAVWNGLHPTGVSWVGFYVHEGGDELILHSCRNKPACSPIGMHGACGQAFKSAAALVVRDVKELGANYVACDPRDQSEVVIPCHENGAVWGVLDLDSFDVGAFDESDVVGLTALLRQAKLTDAP
ncbi:MAG: GAF domain-containing protein [Phycisphaerales bacterium]|nr:GAF domain-containing protein [Phycisphaerales bacterium]MCB9857121.1 GAF domain-containing protein [Phycisphaerales bacterium]MCB9861752.1 GAF domain-containing protein [Phycisphaerales bacterium]